jgi:hypothetical protein
MARSISNFRSKFHPTGVYGYFWLLLQHSIPIQTNNLSKTYNSKWFTKGIKISSKRICFLNSVKRKFSLSREAQAYLKKNTSHTKKY